MKLMWYSRLSKFAQYSASSLRVRVLQMGFILLMSFILGTCIYTHATQHQQDLPLFVDLWPGKSNILYCWVVPIQRTVLTSALAFKASSESPLTFTYSNVDYFQDSLPVWLFAINGWFSFGSNRSIGSNLSPLPQTLQTTCALVRNIHMAGKHI